GTRGGGGSAACSSSTNDCSEPSASTRFSWISRVPRRQVLSTAKVTKPTESGNQPPCAVLVRFAPRKAKSTVKKTAAPIPTSQPGFFQSALAITRKSKVSAVIVP